MRHLVRLRSHVKLHGTVTNKTRTHAYNGPVLFSSPDLFMEATKTYASTSSIFGPYSREMPSIGSNAINYLTLYLKVKNLKFKKALTAAEFYYDYPTGVRILYGLGYIAIGVVFHLESSQGDSLHMFLERLFFTIGISILAFTCLAYRNRKKTF